jgi:hypothetical protein
LQQTVPIYDNFAGLGANFLSRLENQAGLVCVLSPLFALAASYAAVFADEGKGVGLEEPVR